MLSFRVVLDAEKSAVLRRESGKLLQIRREKKREKRREQGRYVDTFCSWHPWS